MYYRNKQLKSLKTAALVTLLGATLSSCSLSLPSFRRNNQATEVSINNAVSQVEPLKRSEYETLKTTKGHASSSTFYILFFPIGRHKTNAELYDNAYYEAVENVGNADGLLFPRQRHRKLFIPLLIVNYSRRDLSVTGLAIKIKSQDRNAGAQKIGE
ncbi:hypothetical protein [Arsenicibacter rosenii]|uniref:Lipoprotein n=1 Tax=Arsenicibacter rosenii TaxID=1750698 RepID=A0A1S2VQB9_9BACT|nr:hypothetical protein [Arsenicibacter rosenii]OIN60376.1 hypothetical protein BLX24_06000 [Arsenicibacter rosenii]